MVGETEQQPYTRTKKDAWGITQSSEKSLIPSIKMYAVELQ
jgi:hypothetical protein